MRDNWNVRVVGAVDHGGGGGYAEVVARGSSEVHVLLNRERLSKEGGSELSSMVGDTNLYLMEKMVQQKLRLW